MFIGCLPNWQKSKVRFQVREKIGRFNFFKKKFSVLTKIFQIMCKMPKTREMPIDMQ
jgi:hypothetical protein